MREITEEFSLTSSKRLYNKEGIETAKKFSWTNTAKKVEEIIYG